MKKIIYVLLVFWPFMACTEDITENITTGDIAGSVSDQTTGEPVATVNVVLNPGGKSTVTGSDGSFSYKDLEPGKYSLEINKKGYKSNTKEILVKEGETSPTHMLIERIPAIVTADKNLLDFGEEKSLNTLSFNIVNSSYEDLSWSIEENCEWITQVKDQSGSLKYGKTETIVVVIDRSKLESGENTSVIVVKSSNGNTEVRVRAVGETASMVVDKKELDFGDNKSLNSLSFTISNKSYGSINWSIDKNCEWVSSVSPLSGILGADKKTTVTVNIDRNKLEGGNNQTVIIVKSELGKEEINITAIGEYMSLPILEIYDATNVKAYTAILNGEITSVGQPTYIERGFVYGLTNNPTIENCIAKVAVPKNDVDKFSCEIKQLEIGQTYYARAYAINGKGTAYSTYSTAFTTSPTLPIVSTQKITDVNYQTNKANLHGTIVSVGEPAYTECGFVYGTSPNPTINDNKRAKNGMSGIGAFSAITVNLPTDQTFYVRAYAINEAGVAYGEDVVVEPEFIVLRDAKLMVQKKDLGEFDWETANSMCENSTLYGYTDWRMPTREEMMVLYNNNDKVKLNNGPDYWGNYTWYWTSTLKDLRYPYAISCKDGKISAMQPSNLHNVRAVRTIQ